METRETFRTGFIAETAMVFTFEVIFISQIGRLFGESASKISTMFSMGNAGISNDTIMQYLLAAVLLTLIKKLCLSNLIFKNMMVLWRTIIMLLGIVGMLVVFIIAFQWFPVSEVSGWIGFILCFSVCFGVCTAVMILKTKLESIKYEKMLKHYKDSNQE